MNLVRQMPMIREALVFHYMTISIQVAAAAPRFR